MNKVLNSFLPKISIQTLPPTYTPFGGYVYITKAKPIHGEKSFEYFLFENGNLCFYPTPNHDLIRQYGNGRYSYWEDTVFLSKLGNTEIRDERLEYNIVNFKGMVWRRLI